MPVPPSHETLNLPAGERRLFPRKILPEVVLIFFGRNGFGRLVNLSEDGMGFEFSGLSETQQVLSLEMSDLATNSIHVDGRLIWVHPLDKIAGLQFVDLTADSKQQIGQWLSTGKFTESRSQLSSAPAGDEAPRQVSKSKPAERPPTPDVAPGPSKDRPPERNSGTRGAQLPGISSLVPEERRPQRQEHDSSGLLSLAPEERPELLTKKDPKLQAWDAYYNRAHIGLDKQSGAWWRIGAALLGLAIFVLAALAGLWVLRSRQSPTEEVLEHSRKTSGSGALPQKGPGSADTTARPFQIEVVDARDRHWLLTFAGRSERTAAPSTSKVASGTAAFPAAMVPQSHTPRSTKTLDTPAVSANQAPSGSNPAPPTVRPQGKNSAEDARSAVPNPSEALPENAAPAPARPAAGKIEPPRLLSSAPPVYPALAQSSNIAGDVVINALIDSTGKVTDMNVISGPILLRESAMETVRTWKYSPARADGQSVPAHLQVTVRYVPR
jgi:TonB family protein